MFARRDGLGEVVEQVIVVGGRQQGPYLAYGGTAPVSPSLRMQWSKAFSIAAARSLPGVVGLERPAVGVTSGAL